MQCLPSSTFPNQVPKMPEPTAMLGAMKTKCKKKMFSIKDHMVRLKYLTLANFSVLNTFVGVS
jgi:hypothetical protein